VENIKEKQQVTFYIWHSLINKPRILIASLLVFQLITGLVIICNGRMENDEGIWSYIGLAWVDYDAVPYKGTVENKTPGIFLLNALSYYFYGVNFIFPRLIGLFTMLISSYLIYKIGKTIRSKLSGFLAALLFFNSTTWNTVNGPYLAHSEIFMIFFNICSFF
jgi:hypothetical protein